MLAPTPVAILGFSANDRLALAASLARTERRTPAYTTVLSIEDARYVIADANHHEVMDLLQALGRVGDAVLISVPTTAANTPAALAPYRETGAIDPALVLQRLDAMLVHSGLPASTMSTARAPSVPAAWGNGSAMGSGNAAANGSANRSTNSSTNRSTNRKSGLADTRPAARPAAEFAPDHPPLAAKPASAGAAAPSSVAAAYGNTPAPVGFARQPSPWHQAHDAARLRRQALHQRPEPLRALLVDDSDIALHFLRRHLERYGVQCDFARDSARALVLLASQTYDLVFLDLDLGDDNPASGLTLCQQVRSAQRYPGGQAPMVVVVSALHQPLQRVGVKWFAEKRFGPGQRAAHLVHRIMKG